MAFKHSTTELSEASSLSNMDVCQARHMQQSASGFDPWNFLDLRIWPEFQPLTVLSTAVTHNTSGGVCSAIRQTDVLLHA